MKHSIVLFVFNRPHLLSPLLDRIKEASPSRLYIFADGPRNIQEKNLTDQVALTIDQFSRQNQQLQLVFTQSKSNLGLKANFIQGLNHVFSQESATVILEDDCLPDPSFFQFTDSMLSRYVNNSRIMSIAGTAPLHKTSYSYDFSRYQLCWGWGTWRRAWKLYDPYVKYLNTPRLNRALSTITHHPHMRLYWRMMLNLVKEGWVDTWDYQWTYSLFINHGLAIIPKVNLVQNLGFGIGATNTKINASISNMESMPLLPPYLHPKGVSDNIQLSQIIENKFYNNPIAILGMLRQHLLHAWSKL